VQQIDIRDEASLAKIGLKWNEDYTELLDVKTGKPLDDFEEMQKKATRGDAVRHLGSSHARRVYESEREDGRGSVRRNYGHVDELPGGVYVSSVGEGERRTRRVATQATNQRDGGNEV
jgi:hypothetical protein